MDYFCDINEVALSGRLTGNAKKIEPKNAAPFVTVDIATNVQRKLQDGFEVKPEYTTVYFSEPHVKMAAQLITGDKIYVKGQLRRGEYKDKQGVSHKTISVSARSLHIFDWRPRDNKADKQQAADKVS